MKNNIELSDLLDELQNLIILVKKVDEKVDSLITKKKEQNQKAKISKVKKGKLNDIEIDQLKVFFNDLYIKWLRGNEIEVGQELENMSPDDLRRIADANNLNVTSKMSKEKVLNLIGLRFREKKMLSSNYNVTKPLNDIKSKK